MASCPICFNSVKSPSCCIPCGHLFCTACIHRWINGNHVGLSAPALASCPQCRTSVDTIQRVRFDADDNGDVHDVIVLDPWNESDFTNIFISATNIWKKSALKKSLSTLYDNVMSHEYSRVICSKCRTYGDLGVRAYRDFQNAGAGLENKVNWFRNRVPQGFQKLKNYMYTHPAVESAKERWQNLNEEHKFMVTIAIVVCLLLILADVQNEEGLFQSVIVPIFYTFLYTLYQILWCIFYIIIRPIWCSVICTYEVVLAIADIFGETIIGLLNILTAMVMLPVTVIWNLVRFLIATITLALKTFVPLFVVVYFLSPNVQQRCRQFLAQLQQNAGR
ncbi:hypothetical protein KUTeg_019873 [Tegillarca granosa]|uniref:RING-type domain-containing protein n=1 Tax=Tegillarca granosa TaxID=220873 RepID=A0ABQ9EIT8_TEGGR|nr:hypothetical protein KUTeg_019873 [Tegillarca granosa]